MNMEKLGNIGIGDIPQLTNSDKVKTSLPLSDELCESVKSTDYYSRENECNKLVTNLQSNGGAVFYSQSARTEFGNGQVMTAMSYYKAFLLSSKPSNEEKIAVCGWIADNIFDIERMTSTEE